MLHITHVELAKRKLKLLLQLTPAEKEALAIFRRLHIPVECQSIIGPYIVDFRGLTHNFILEIDGSVHYNQDEYDSRRDAWLTNQGYNVFRVENKDVTEVRLRYILSQVSLYGQ